eukprot:1228764-Amphidinium_carterae.2
MVVWAATCQSTPTGTTRLDLILCSRPCSRASRPKCENKSKPGPPFDCTVAMPFGPAKPPKLGQTCYPNREISETKPVREMLQNVVQNLLTHQPRAPVC